MAGGDGGGVADRGSWATSSSSPLPPLSTQKATPSATPTPAAPGVGGQGGGHLLPSSALTEGEYLLHLIQKGSRSQPGPPRPPPSSAAPGVGGGGGNHDDPAVAALGPIIPLPRQPSTGGFPPDAGASLNPHPHGPPWAGYPGFHHAPWAASSSEFGPRRPPPPGFPHQPQNFYHQYNSSPSGVIPAFSPPQLAFLPGHFDAKDLQGNPGHSQHLRQPRRDAFSTEGVPPVFGSLIQFPPDKIDGSSRGVEIRRDVVNSHSVSQKIPVDCDQERERLLANRRSFVDRSFPESNWTHQPKGHQRPSHPRRDNGERVGQKQQGSPHPGSGKVEQGRALYLPRKAKDVVNPVLSSNARNREHTVEKQVAHEKGEAKEILHNEESILSRHPELGTQFDQSTPSLGNHAHSSLASDGKEHRENLHFGRVSTVLSGDQIIDAGVGRCICVNDSNEAQELSSEQVMDSLMLTDEIAEKRVEPHAHASRGKDYRSDSRGCRVLSQGMRNRQRVLRCRRDIASFTLSFVAIYESLIPTEEEKAKQKQLLQSLEKLVVKEWPNSRLHLYGSCANSFGVSNCDIDVCLEIDDNGINKSEIILKLADILQSNNLQNVQALTRARVPIVKLMDPVTGISCDICINNILAVVNTKLLRDYAQVDDRLRQLAFIVKHWAKSRGVNDTYQGTLSSYAYVLMCIHFLQLRKPAVLPCLQEMVATYDETVDGIKCSFFDQVEKLHDFGAENRESIAELLWAFFSYWAYHHDYKNDVISVRTGGIISKESKDWTRRIGNDRHLICIEDPFELSHDLGRVVDKYTVKIVREEFERAAEIMQNDLNPSVRLFEPYVRVSEED